MAVLIYTTHPYIVLASGFVLGALTVGAMWFGATRK
ncbi:hypothetical protein GGR75_001826 [Xanthomonas campestris]|nr:hypothetical protein [Xanthomonas campestris]